MIRWLAGLLLLVLASSCSRTHRLTVGSKNFTEQIILGEIVAQQLERLSTESIQSRTDDRLHGVGQLQRADALGGHPFAIANNDRALLEHGSTDLLQKERIPTRALIKTPRKLN